jgi:NosR/NirI family transcriptional regulator, nitrous oxide reductase regulator
MMAPATGRLTVFSCGLFSLAAEVLLLRRYLSVWGADDPCIGMFVAASFLWFVMGTALGKKTRHPFSAELAVLACVPAVAAQYGLTVLMGGIQAGGSAVVPPLHELLIWSLVVTAPGGLVTGWVLRQVRGMAGCRVYGYPAAGALVGGAGVVMLLSQGVAEPSVVMILAMVLCGSAVWSTYSGPRPHPRATQVATLACLTIVAGALALRVDAVLTKVIQQYQWHRVQPNGSLKGSFSTTQGEHLYGENHGHWVVVRNGRVFETVADHKQAGSVAAMALAQNYTAQRVLVVGDGLSVCEAFLKSPRVTLVEWFHPDPQYIQAMLADLPQELHVPDARLRIRVDDIRATLGDKPEQYDIVLVNLSSNINASLNRYVSAEFFAQVRKALTPMGFLVLGIPTDEHAKNLEAGYLGAWVKTTLDSVFTQTIPAPQERMFFLAADTSFLRVSPTSLVTHFSLLENAQQILPPEELESVYRPDKATECLDSYGLVNLPAKKLLNRDQTPSYPLCHLLLMMEKSGWSAIKPVGSFLRGGPILVMVGIVLLGLVRVTYTLRTAPGGRRPFDLSQAANLRSDVLWILGCSAAAGIGLLVVTVNACQIQGGPGSLFFGWVVSLFAGGFAAAAFAARRIMPVPEKPGLSQLRLTLWALLGCLTLLAAGLAALGFRGDQLPVDGLLAVSAAGGFICGVILVLGMHVFQMCGGDEEASAGDVAIAGSAGVAVGTALAGTVLLPLLHLQAAWYVGAAIALVAIALAGAAQIVAAHPGRRCIPHARLTPAAYGLFGVALCLLAGMHVVRFVERSQASVADSIFIEQWIKGSRVTTRTARPAGSAKNVTYQEVREGSRLKGYIFRSEDLTGTVYGYGGAMSTIMFTKPDGTLIDFRLTRSHETPRYMTRIREWIERLKGKTMFDADPIAGVNTVTGATYSTRAILTLLRNSGRQFAASVLVQGQPAPAASLPWTRRINWGIVAWSMAIPLALAAIYHGRRWSRILVLAYTAAVSGFWLNRQFSTDQVVRLLDLESVLSGSLATLLLLLGIPVLILLVGNIYCGYLCPFGAVQELLGLVLPTRWKARLSRPVMGVARYLKYAVLFVLIAAVFGAGDKRLMEMDPLSAFFSREFWSGQPALSAGLVIAGVVLGAGLIVTRLWCRYLCPTGAFLSLFNLAAWLQRFLPAKKFGRCEFGLSGRDHLDCIHCDRCRYPSAPATCVSSSAASTGTGAEVARD